MIGIKEAMRMKKDLDLGDMSEECYLSVLRNYMQVEKEFKPKECVVYFHNSILRVEFKLLAYTTDNSWLMSLTDDIDDTQELRLLEPELSLIMKIIGNGLLFSNLKNHLQEVGKNRFKW